MSVLIEGISVVVQCQTIKEKYPNGLSAYEAETPNQTHCSDEFLVRVGFMSPDDVKHFVEKLQGLGLEFIHQGKAREIAVVDQMRGVTTDCDWLQYARHPKGYAFAWRADKSPSELAVPKNWEFQKSLSCGYTFIDSGDVKQRLHYIRTDAGIDVFRDELTDREIFLGRPEWAR